jgi:transposase
MSTRQERGLQIATTKKIEKNGDTWLVPSQSSNRIYVVRPNPERPYCSCPDHDALGIKCKHLFAVDYVMQREKNPDGSETVTQTVIVKDTCKKQSYPQIWEAYNAAQTNEKDKFQSLLHDLCRNIQTPVQSKGRPRVNLADAVFAACFKVYSTFSGRRFMSDLRAAHEKGYVSKLISYNSIFKAFENPELFPILKALIVESSLPLKAVEKTFAVDSSGFSTCRFEKWFDEKYGKEKTGRIWVKAHICCGTKTNVVTAVEILEMHTSDSSQFKPLVKKTAEQFTMEEVSADKAYSSRIATNAVDEVGGVPFIAFKSNATGGVGGLYQKMFHYFCFRQEEFLKHYHLRSNVESTFGMIKAKFRDHVRSKTDTAMKNEVLAKILCHNICVLIQEMYELGIQPEFWQDKTACPQNETSAYKSQAS